METVLAALLAATVGWSIGRDGKVQIAQPENQVTQSLIDQKPELVKPVDIDSSVARDTVEYRLQGSSIFLQNPEELSAPVYIQLNEPDAPKQDISQLRKIDGIFYRFFITNAVGSGILHLIISRSKAYDFTPSQVNINITAATAIIGISVTAATIMMPIDLQGAYIMMPVDIQAQYLNLKIDIVAQSIGNIDINIAGQVANVTIAIAAQNVAIALPGDWSAQQETDVYKPGTTSLATQTGGYVIDEIVPAGQTWYITQWSIVGYSSTQNAPFRALLECPGASFVSFYGNDYGGTVNCPKPWKAKAGEHVKVYVFNYAGFTATFYAQISGYKG